MDIRGELLIGGEAFVGSGPGFQGIEAASGHPIEPTFPAATAQDLDRACGLAAEAFTAFRDTAPEARARFLESIAQNILDIGDALIVRCMAESGLPRPRLEGERGRTVGQLRMFAGVLRDGGFLQARIDPALPERKPLPRPDLRLRMIGVGPVAVFGASNFPLAFSVAGGDTAAALAAGCPVVAKAHPAHPGTSELVGRAVQKAVADCGLPAGTFALLFDGGRDIGQGLVADPRIMAVGFTGSRAGGIALMKIAAARPHPIPVYAEMSSINPVVLLPGALAARGEAIGREFVASVALGAGQFCTNPGLLLAIEGPALDGFVASAKAAMAETAAATMLTPGIAKAYEAGVSVLEDHAAVETLARGRAGEGLQGQAGLFSTHADAFLTHPELGDEVFGAAGLLVRCRDAAQLQAVLESLEGQLTAALHMVEADHPTVRTLLPVLETKVGRILVNGFGTGVEVADAMVHGGPFPATSDGRTTSVGSLAIDRFLRPVSYQGLPDALLPDALKDANPLKLWRRVDGAVKAP
ncbi:aldehyde dehydrogenase (NADP(+)) [Lichenihabitans sp. Uapishka_5]|uniref:aldehyde dehydrogenase (NADP(+)) n=1 Tax=Lichenihabitans sp. Uapishka_5 TaxID=3037302 RepID=UPI0029E7E2A0|nr:aldehyde dehydrogenase (NADP(+)) [Lichenihabitans sp. Uapishka_5]MDX7951909.1 aldehyde dehydrogenase (NADP(+)) [Lichenihabitans sp. Uapishka_5]